MKHNEIIASAVLGIALIISALVLGIALIKLGNSLENAGRFTAKGIVPEVVTVRHVDIAEDPLAEDSIAELAAE